MAYHISPEAWKQMFPIPADIVDNHIRLAGALQLKVLLVLFRYSAEGADEEKIAQILKTDPADVRDAMHYWAENGILTEGGTVSQIKSAPIPQKPEPVQPMVQQETKAEIKSVPASINTVAPLPEIKPDLEQIASRCDECPELRYLYAEAQSKLGRTIGYDGQASLLMLHDNCGLPVEVILMLIAYCVSIDKKNMNYILKVGKSWAEKDIDTLEKAESEIERLTSQKNLWNRFKALTGITTPRPSSKQSEFLYKWSEEWGFSCDMIYLAYEEMLDHTDKISFPYMDRILENWKGSGITTPQLLMKNRQEREQSKNTNNQPKKVQQSNAPSYDVDEFIKRAMQGAAGQGGEDK